MQLVVHIYWCGWWRRIQISVGESTHSLFPPVKITVQPLHWSPNLINNKKQLARPDTSSSHASRSLTHPRLETTPRGHGWIDLNHPRRSSPGVIAHHWSKRTQRPPVTLHLWHPLFQMSWQLICAGCANSRQWAAWWIRLPGCRSGPCQACLQPLCVLYPELSSMRSSAHPAN